MEAPSLDAIKTDAQAFGREALDSARKNLIEPGMQAAREARDVMSVQYDRAEENFAEQRDRAAAWISANPFTAVGIALGAGLVLTALLKPSR